MREMIWLDSAVNDMVQLREFIASENPSAAKKAAIAIKESTKQLLEAPAIGKPVQDLPQYRDMLVRFGAAGYVIRYRVHAAAIYIVHVRHYRELDFKI